MGLEGPVNIFRRVEGAEQRGQRLLFAKDLQTVLQVPFGQNENKGRDHAEGMTLFSTASTAAQSVLAVFDSASDGRVMGAHTVRADIFELRE